MTGRAAGAALLVAAMAAAGGLIVQAPGAPSAVKYRPPASVPRLVPEPFTVPDLGRLTSFDATEDHLYLLDGLNHRVIRLDRSDGAGWRAALSFGRGGAGPGEFGFPTGIAVATDGAVTVADGNRLHEFDGEGRFLGTRTFALGCAHYGPDVVSFGETLLLTASCWQQDTLVMVLAEVSGTGVTRRIATEPRATLDGRFGSYLVGGGAVADGHRFLFGTGIRPCLLQGDSAEGIHPVCEVARDLYGDRPHRETEEFLRQQREQRPMAARALRWPAAFPVYKRVLMAPGGDVLFREFTQDSVVLRYVGSEADLLVAGLNGLVGCRRLGCLWEFPQAEGAGIFLMRAASVEAHARR